MALDGVRGVESDVTLDKDLAEQSGYTYHVYYMDDS